MSDSLFSARTDGADQPLAARMRPRTLDEFVGQDHILGPGRLLRRAVSADRVSSLILSGPPGTGKTTIAEIIAGATRGRFVALNAVLSGIKELRYEIEQASEAKNLYGRRTILFVDEVHRWNKAQQDALLPWVESGTVILVGATTENPYFEVNSALVSRSRVFTLKKLSNADLYAIAAAALQDIKRGYGAYRVDIDPKALDHLVQVADGDARTLLGAIELAVETTPERFPPPKNEHIHITMDVAEDSIQRKALLYDKEGDYHFDSISAFIKSLRGSDPDAALYWMARMIAAGEDPRFLLRRMLIAASEDVGMADPQALVVVAAAGAAYDRVGMPEGQFHLSQAALYLATAPKSNSTMGYFDARATVEKEAEAEVPRHLRDPNRDGKHLGHGEGYMYPHAYRDHWVAQAYLPTRLSGRVFYQPAATGRESEIRREVHRRRELQLSAAVEEEDEILSTAPRTSRRDEWLRRAEGQRSRLHGELRDKVFEWAAPARHARVLVLGRGMELFLFEAARRCPEGLVVGLCEDTARAESLIALKEKHVGDDPAEALHIEPLQTDWQERLLGYSEGAGYELIMMRDGGLHAGDRLGFFTALRGLLSPGGQLVAAERVADAVPKLSALLTARLNLDRTDASLIGRLQAAEASFYSGEHHGAYGWTSTAVHQVLTAAKFCVRGQTTLRQDEKRRIAHTDIQNWIPQNPADAKDKSYGAALLTGAQGLSEDEYRQTSALMHEHLGETEHTWPLQYCLFHVEPA
ncbi:MAG: AAA family ATPase [Spirochaeta sp.]|nr:AAA family ATPase [Spirochaeta sp.]